jgi:peptidoglycan/xylan/chitin deacetylase (PgdA/CDA1 family)
MMSNLWSSNLPQNFWLCQPDFPDEVWQQAVVRSMPLLGLDYPISSIDQLLEYTLGERQFGADRYRFGFTRSLYYWIKPLLPKLVKQWLHQIYGVKTKDQYLKWPIEDRFVQFQWEILRQVLLICGKQEVPFAYFWPEGKQFAFVITHDVEMAEGQRLIPVLADLEESLGFRSIFNVVPERYPLDFGLIKDLEQRGFEIGIHGLKHDGKLFQSYEIFSQRAVRINHYLEKLRSVGFRSPYTHRNLEWMQLLDLNYDLSCFDTDPYEPMPGGTMSIWPFRIGRFLELPYTLPQDSTMFNILGEKSPRIWSEKTAFIRKHHGMALMLVHPDYSAAGVAKGCYAEFLQEMQAMSGYWHALPREVAAWWQQRSQANDRADKALPLAHACLTNDMIEIDYLHLSDKTDLRVAQGILS